MSRVVQFCDFSLDAETVVQSVLRGHSPVSCWQRKDTAGQLLIFAVFRTWNEARVFLQVTPAKSSLFTLESVPETKLEPYATLQPLGAFLTPPSLHHKSSASTLSSTSSSASETLHSSDADSMTSVNSFEYTISSNPPNPKTVFRHGDWICPSAKCSTHNFGRNTDCINCSASRPPLPVPRLGPPITAAAPSPRFCELQLLQQPQPSFSRPLALPHQPLLQPQQCILTPSGRAFAVGGHVQNINLRDPLNPTTMFWPNNEPFPDPGQIRPPGIGTGLQPPIMNTGNRGPIETQPGDWVCTTCQYLNWRRRRICVSCYPFHAGAEPSHTALAERMTLLASIYTSNQQHQLSVPLLGQTPSQSNVLGILQALQMPQVGHPVASGPKLQYTPTVGPPRPHSQVHVDQFHQHPMASLRQWVPGQPVFARRSSLPNVSPTPTFAPWPSSLRPGARDFSPRFTAQGTDASVHAPWLRNEAPRPAAAQYTQPQQRITPAPQPMRINASVPKLPPMSAPTTSTAPSSDWPDSAVTSWSTSTTAAKSSSACPLWSPSTNFTPSSVNLSENGRAGGRSGAPSGWPLANMTPSHPSTPRSSWPSFTLSGHPDLEESSRSSPPTPPSPAALDAFVVGGGYSRGVRTPGLLMGDQQFGRAEDRLRIERRELDLVHLVQRIQLCRGLDEGGATTTAESALGAARDWGSEPDDTTAASVWAPKVHTEKLEPSTAWPLFRVSDLASPMAQRSQ